MAAANASARGQRSAILVRPLHELTGFYLAVDCMDLRCRRDRVFAISDLADFYGRRRTVAEVLHRMRCAKGCGGWVAAGEGVKTIARSIGVGNDTVSPVKAGIAA